MLLILHVVLLLPAIITALPTHAGSAALSASFSGAATKPLISFDNGGIGVNFAGYHASAGLGGLLTGNAADGGLHAEAGTPHGQSAGAGLGGAVDGSGNTAGYNYYYAKDMNPVNVLSSFLPLSPPEVIVITTQVPKETEVETLE